MEDDTETRHRKEIDDLKTKIDSRDKNLQYFEEQNYKLQQTDEEQKKLLEEKDKNYNRVQHLLADTTSRAREKDTENVALRQRYTQLQARVMERERRINELEALEREGQEHEDTVYRLRSELVQVKTQLDKARAEKLSLEGEHARCQEVQEDMDNQQSHLHELTSILSLYQRYIPYTEDMDLDDLQSRLEERSSKGLTSPSPRSQISNKPGSKHRRVVSLEEELDDTENDDGYQGDSLDNFESQQSGLDEIKSILSMYQRFVPFTEDMDLADLQSKLERLCDEGSGGANTGSLKYQRAVGVQVNLGEKGENSDEDDLEGGIEEIGRLQSRLDEVTAVLSIYQRYIPRTQDMDLDDLQAKLERMRDDSTSASPKSPRSKTPLLQDQRAASRENDPGDTGSEWSDSGQMERETNSSSDEEEGYDTDTGMKDNEVELETFDDDMDDDIDKPNDDDLEQEIIKTSDDELEDGITKSSDDDDDDLEDEIAKSSDDELEDKITKSDDDLEDEIFNSSDDDELEDEIAKSSDDDLEDGLTKSSDKDRVDESTEVSDEDKEKNTNSRSNDDEQNEITDPRKGDEDETAEVSDGIEGWDEDVESERDSSAGENWTTHNRTEETKAADKTTVSSSERSSQTGKGSDGIVQSWSERGRTDADKAGAHGVLLVQRRRDKDRGRGGERRRGRSYRGQWWVVRWRYLVTHFLMTVVAMLLCQNFREWPWAHANGYAPASRPVYTFERAGEQLAKMVFGGVFWLLSSVFGQTWFLSGYAQHLAPG